MIQTCPNVETLKEATETDWQELGLKALTILLIPVIWTIGFFLSFIVAYVVIGAFYLGRILALLVHALLLPVMGLLDLSQETRNKVYLGIHCVCCPLGAVLLVSTVWR